MSAQGELCNVLFGEFKDAFGISLAELCPVCHIPGARHLREPSKQLSTSSDKNLLSATAQAFMKLKDHLPKFDIKTTECRNFLKQVELVLTINDGIPQQKWSLVFLYIIKEVAAATWIKENIVDTNLDWNESKKKFISHFQRAEYSSLLINKYDSMKQQHGESVQNYSDRFTDLCDELDRPDDDPLVISHYTKHLNVSILKQFQNYLTNVRISKHDCEFHFKSLKEVIEICIMYDIQSAVITSSNNDSNVSESKKQFYHDKSKYCEIHKKVGHDTSDCIFKDKNVSDSESNMDSGTAKQNDKSNVICHKCSQKGHYANECPMGKGVSNAPSGPTAGNTPNAVIDREKREVRPPQRLTYDKPGGTSSGNVSSKRAIICARSSIVPNKSGVWLIDKTNNRKFNTLVDTGADVSFMDADLAIELNLQIVPTTGQITLASSKQSIERKGCTSELPFIAMIGTSDLNDSKTIIKSVKHNFELMNLETSQYDFIIGTDLLPTLFPSGIPLQFYSSNANVTANTVLTSFMGRKCSCSFCIIK